MDANTMMEFDAVQAEAKALMRIDWAVKKVKPVAVYGAMSGGYDSLCASYLASQSPLFDGIVHINTGIGIEETREFVRQTCEEQGWSLHEYNVPEIPYADLVMAKGFPGPAAHTFMYRNLKERALRVFTKERKAALGANRLQRIVIVSGPRLAESVRRMGKTKLLSKDDARWWVAPMLDWPNHAPRMFARLKGLRGNPVSDHLHMSGECKCGAYASPGERELTALFYPELEREIERLEFYAAKRGVPSVWGVPPQPGMNKYPVVQGVHALMCSGCEV